MDRRSFLEIGTAASLAMALTPGASGEAKPIRVGVVGVGGRGRGLLRNLLRIPNVQVPALCDINKRNLANAQNIVVKAGQEKPEGYSKDEHDYKNMMQRDDLDAVVIATYWEWHTPMAVCAMKNGKYVGVEVPAALSLEECWQLVDTSEKTGMPCMMLENWSYRRDNLAVLNMIRAGLLGEIVHCHCAHSHDCIDHWFFSKKTGKDRWPAKYLVNYNRDQYPTHSLGPVLSWLDINCGDAFATLTSTATDSKGINAYMARKFGADHPGAKRTYKQGDIVTSVVRTHGGKSIVINYDLQLPRPYDNRWEVQGTLGVYNEQRESIYLAGKSPKYHKYEPFAPYQDEYDHSWWKKSYEMAKGSGHGGVDFLTVRSFVEAARAKVQTPIDVYDSVTMSCVVPLSGMSIAQGSAPVECPDFTRGKWKTRKPEFGVEG
jgi:predicted dehydrogenase